METDSCTVPQSGAEGIVQSTTFRQGDDVDVIEESEHSFTITKLPLQVADRVMLRQGVKSGHQVGVALFATLALAHLMRAPVVIAPCVDARRRIDLFRIELPGATNEYLWTMRRMPSCCTAPPFGLPVRNSPLQCSSVFGSTA